MSNSNSLETIKGITGSIELISEALLLMKDQRVTLEEKMIRNHLHELAENLANSLASIHCYFKTKNYDIEEKLIEDLNRLVQDIQSVVGELLKIIKYNWNFLEQYFEHEYFARLKNEHKFIERLNKITSSIENS